MVKVARTIPFDYYNIQFTPPSNNNLTSKVSHYAKELFKNLGCLIANVGIKAANILHLYRFTKIELKLPPQMAPFYTPNQAIATSAFLLSKAASLILGEGFISRHSMSFAMISQSGKGTGIENAEDYLIRSVFFIGQVFFSNQPLFRLSFGLWASYSVVNNACRGLKTCYSKFHRDPIEAAKGVAINIINVAAAISFFNQSFKKIPA